MKYVITADWHLREDLPVCRNDEDWFYVQQQAVRSVFSYAEKVEADVIVCGDVFHRSHVHPSLVTMLLQEIARFKQNVFVIPGQHDLPYHSLDYVQRSSFGNLLAVASMQHTNLFTADRIGVTLPYGSVKSVMSRGEGKDIQGTFLIIHQLTLKESSNLFPADSFVTAKELLQQFPGVQYIFTGDNHSRFLYQEGTRAVVNPGCLLRQSADLVDYTPGFYVLSVEGGAFEFVPVYDPGLVSNAHITKEKERNDRIEAFIASIEKGKELSLDFVINLRNRSNQLSSQGRAVLEEIIEELNIR